MACCRRRPRAKFSFAMRREKAQVQKGQFTVKGEHFFLPMLHRIRNTRHRLGAVALGDRRATSPNQQNGKWQPARPPRSAPTTGEVANSGETTGAVEQPCDTSHTSGGSNEKQDLENNKKYSPSSSAAEKPADCSDDNSNAPKGEVPLGAPDSFISAYRRTTGDNAASWLRRGA